MFGEPPRSQYDLHFNFLGFPVRVNPWFWAIAAMLSIGGANGELLNVFIGIAAVFLGILVHELGHAFAMRSCGLRPWITLYGMGGLTAYDTSQLMSSGASDWKKQIFISFAGPGAGFILAAFLFLIIKTTGHQIYFAFGTRFRYFFAFDFDPFASQQLSLFVYYTIFISLMWGLLNLLPVYPLDGGQISREIFLRINRPTGLRRSLTLSMVTAGLIAVYFLFMVVKSSQMAAQNGGGGGRVSILPIILFGYLCFSSWSMLQMISGGGRRW